jgi:hypothetical protein
MDEQARLREVSWQDLFPWVRIVSALRLAISPSLLALAALGILAMYAGWSAIGTLYSESENATVQQMVEQVHSWPWQGEITPREIPDEVGDARASPFLAAWNNLSEWFERIFDWRLDRGMARYTDPATARLPAPTLLPFTMIVLLALWALIVWSLFGAAITRIAAVALARGDRLGFRAGLAHGIRRWPMYLGGPAIPLVGAAIVAIPLLILGLLMQVDFFVILGGLIWPLSLLAGFIMALLLIGLAVGWPLMWATISVEATDPFDALSRSYSYAFHRPIRYLFYVIVAAILGLLGWYVVSLFHDWILKLTYWGLSWGATVDRTAEIAREAYIGGREEWGTLEYGGAIIGFWHVVLKMLALGFIFSYFWSAATMIYYLLRKDEDGTEMTEVTYEDGGDVRGMPPLATDTMGVPSVSDKPPAPDPGQSPPPPIT